MRIGALVLLGTILAITFNNCDMGMEAFNENAATNPSTGGNNNTGNNTNPTNGPSFFAQRVKTVFAARCNSCHIENFPNGPAPITIYDYTAMKTMMSMGTGRYDNNLIKKVSNTSPTTHTGLNQCPNGLTVSPCKEIADWWGVENGSSTTTPGGTALAILGGIDFSSANGMLYGMAVDPNRQNDIVTVTFYINGPRGTGTMLGSVSASGQQFDPNYPNHAFSYQLPSLYLDGKNHNVYAYGRTATVNEILLKNTSFAAVAYPKSANWQTFYNANIAPTCTDCHAFSAQQAYDMLANPLRAKGGTATTNDLIKTAANISFHSGGNRCGTVNQGVCAQMQNWWNQEFGPYPP